MNLTNKTVPFLAWIAFGLVACVSRNDIDELKEQQRTILSKLDTLDKKVVGSARPQGPSPQQAGPSPDTVYAFPLGKSVIRGNPDAWVTIVEVSDFQCPFCSRVTDTLKQVEAKFKGDVRFVFKHNPLPFHPRALPAAIAADCAGEHGGKFWPMHDAIFAQQDKLADADFEAHAKKLGLPMEAWKKCLAEPSSKERVVADQALANKLGARGTPAFFINGHFLSGAQPFASFESVVSKALASAKASGVPAARYYETEIIGKGQSAL